MPLGKRTKTKRGYKQVTGYHEVECHICNDEVLTVALDIARVTCGKCVQGLVAPPENYTKQASATAGFPRGWHFKKKFEAPDGKVYSFGKLVENEELEVVPTQETSSKAKTVSKKRGRKKK